MIDLKKETNDYRTLLNQCDKELDDIYHSYAASYNLSDAALWIIYVIYDTKESVTQSDICSYWCFSRQTINTALKGLEQQDIIRLEPVPGNRKSKNIVFTDNGENFVRSIMEPLIEAENSVFTSLDDSERKMLVKLTQKRCLLLREFLKK